MSVFTEYIGSNFFAKTQKRQLCRRHDLHLGVIFVISATFIIGVYDAHSAHKRLIVCKELVKDFNLL